MPFRARVVAKLVGVPAVAFPPGGEFGLLGGGQTVTPLDGGFVRQLGQELGRREGQVAAAGNGAAVALGRVLLAG
jgi:hypothetical protein